MKKYYFIISISLILTLTPSCHAFSMKGAYSNQNMAKYYPQAYNYNYNYRRCQQNNRIYSAQQARYYGYNLPQSTTNPYYRR